MRRCLLLNPGMVEYGRAWDLQKRLFLERSHDRITDTLILLQHPPTYTFGRRSLPEQPALQEEYDPKIAFYRVDRGGGATYHGPGQVIAYPILELRTYTHDFYTYLRMLEDVIMDTLTDFNISSERVWGYTGVWADGKKIGSIGVRIVRGFTMHGLSLNVNNDLAPFSKIVPCNIHGVEITSMSKILSTTLSIPEVEISLSHNFGRVFNVDMEIECIENRIQSNC
ncbi:MAG: lipoyl(octanoyl) transferase LipB [Nitrospirae bacterium]|nr:lipoyl(octanoyl) transferase LipB [Nitrospirota bacterium]